MLLLANTTDTIDLVTDAAVTVDVHVSYMDLSTSTLLPTGGGRQQTAITTATTTPILAAPAASTLRNVKYVQIRNKSGSTSVTVLVRFNANGTVGELHAAVLRAGEALEFAEGVGWFPLSGAVGTIESPSVADQSLTAGAANYLTGSKIKLTALPTVGLVLRWQIWLGKTAAGTGTTALALYFGPNGTTADTSRNATGNLDTETAVADEAMVWITATIRGPIGAACIVQAGFSIENNLSTTGLSNTARKAQVKAVQSAGFDVTGLPLFAGVVVTPGASDVMTVRQCIAEIERS